MSSVDKNKIFFGLMNYVLSEQNNVKWILKTSLINFTGMNSVVSTKKYKTKSLSDDVIEHINQVKPYHTQFEQFIEKYTSKNEKSTIKPIDEDNITANIRFDAVSHNVDKMGSLNKYEYMNTTAANRLWFERRNNFEDFDLFGYVRKNKIYDQDSHLIYNMGIDNNRYVIDENEHIVGLMNTTWYQSVKIGVTIVGYINNETIYDFYNNVIGYRQDGQLIYTKDPSKTLTYGDSIHLVGYQTQIYNLINDKLNCHFKGIEVNGQGFDIDKIGYETFLYDTSLYDAKTISDIYYFVENKEYDGGVEVSHDYSKEFIPVGISTIKLNRAIQNKIAVYKKKKGGNYIPMSSEEYEYYGQDLILRLTSSIETYDKIRIYDLDDDNNIVYGYYFYAIPFEQTEDEMGNKRLADISQIKFTIPNEQFGRQKVIVHKENSVGTRQLTTLYTIDDTTIELLVPMEEDEKLIITCVDYAEIYDKIYTYEDCYGQSNCLISLDGNEFLRPYYENNRPSELAVTYPISNLKVYQENDNNQYIKCYEIDHKHTFNEYEFDEIDVTTLTEDLKSGDKEIRVNDISKIQLPYTENNIRKPGRIMINSEIIEFYDYTTGGILKSIRRGTNGTYIADIHLENSNVYAIKDKQMTTSIMTNNYKSKFVNHLTSNLFEIPGTMRKKTNISVFKTTNIQLLEDITPNSQSFLISSNEVILPTNDKKGCLFIEGEKLYFDTITQVKKGYKISGFETTKSYKADETNILSTKMHELSSSEYTFAEDKQHIILKVEPSYGEVVTVYNCS